MSQRRDDFCSIALASGQPWRFAYHCPRKNVPGPTDRHVGSRVRMRRIMLRRSAEGQYEQLTDLAAELVRLKVDVVVAGSPVAVRPAQQATTTIPDPVGNGFVASLARPGGNTTGLAGSWTTLLRNNSNCLRP
jgi:hypothetical protein